MARPCTVCTHPKLEEIDEQLVAGHSHRAVATAHGLGRWAVLRHRKNHLSPALREAYAKREADRGETLIDQLVGLQNHCEGILEAAWEEGRPTIGLLAARELRQTIELIARIMGQLDGNGITINTQPVVWQITHYGAGLDAAEVLRVLEPWPEALAAVRGLLPPPAPTSPPVLDRPPRVPVPTRPAATVVPTSALATADGELLRQVETRRREEALVQQTTEPRR